MLAFVRILLDLRREHPVLRRRRWFQGQPIRGIDDIAWFRPDGEEMNDEDWGWGEAATLGMFLNGEALRLPDPHGHRILDDSFLLLFNAYHEAVPWTLPEARWGAAWKVLVDTTRWEPAEERLEAGVMRPVGARSVLVLVRDAA
jgi:glycogen operon protein